MVGQRVIAVHVGTGPFFNQQREHLIALAERHGLVDSVAQREPVEVGAVMSYSTPIKEMYRQGGIYAARILKGEKPGDLPVMLPTKFELVINLKAAKARGIEIPPMLLARADEVIE
jgi:putative ABC transport system substrate-binding protein